MTFEQMFPFLFPIFFASLWLGVSLIIAHIGGWAKLAQQYRSDAEFTGQTWSFRSGRMGWTNYGTCLTVGSNYYGLYLAVFFLFRAGHPPLLIPWDEITVGEHQEPALSYLEFTFDRDPSVTFKVPRKLGETILKARRGSPEDVPIG